MPWLCQELLLPKLLPKNLSLATGSTGGLGQDVNVPSLPSLCGYLPAVTEGLSAGREVVGQRGLGLPCAELRLWVAFAPCCQDATGLSPGYQGANAPSVSCACDARVSPGHMGADGASLGCGVVVATGRISGRCCGDREHPGGPSLGLLPLPCPRTLPEASRSV